MGKKIKLSSIIPDDKNNNKHTAYGMDLLEKSVNKVGIIESITISNDDKIISGNARHEVIGKNFEKEALVIETDGTQPIVIKRTDIESDTKQFYEASILANTTSKKNIDFDMEVIDALAVEYDIDIVDLGVDIVNEEILEAEEDDFNGVAPKEPITVLGDLYEIGEHRLLCGDSTDSDQVAKLMNGEKADMVFTDPPYNVSFNGRSGRFDVIENDDLDTETFDRFIEEVAQTIHTLEIPIKYIWCNWKFYGTLQKHFNLNACIVWAKNVFGLGRGYRHQHEFCFFEGKLDEGINNESDLWEIKKDSNYMHPTQKPIELSARALGNHKNANNILDLFGGSGSTLVGIEQLKRKGFIMELDPKYCDVIVARMIKLDSALEIKRNGIKLTQLELDKFTDNTSEAK